MHNKGQSQIQVLGLLGMKIRLGGPMRLLKAL